MIEWKKRCWLQQITFNRNASIVFLRLSFLFISLPSLSLLFSFLFSFLSYLPQCRLFFCFFLLSSFFFLLSFLFFYFYRLICDLLTHSRTERLGYDSDDKVLHHEYFDGIDFTSIYLGPGPFILELNGAGDTR